MVGMISSIMGSRNSSKTSITLGVMLANLTVPPCFLAVLTNEMIHPIALLSINSIF